MSVIAADDFIAMVRGISRADVPCGSCTRCCRGNSIVMLMEHDGDDIDSYQHEYVTLPGAGYGPILKRQQNGDCIYLGAGGCTIHDRAPVVCRAFDCRNAYRGFMSRPRHERRRMIKDRLIDRDILETGRRLGRDEEAA